MILHAGQRWSAICEADGRHRNTSKFAHLCQYFAAPPEKPQDRLFQGRLHNALARAMRFFTPYAALATGDGCDPRWLSMSSLLASIALGVGLSSMAFADPHVRDYTEVRIPCAHFNPLRQPFFGDLHIHTKYSLDAATQGTLTNPDQAYEFAKGQPLGVQPWQGDAASRTLHLDRPLDFAMVADHAELLGETQLCSDTGAQQYTAWQCYMYREWPRAAYYWFNYWSAQHRERVGFCQLVAEGESSSAVTDVCKGAGMGPWQDIQRAAQRHYDRSTQCEFTTFVGYEWTGGASGKRHGNIHRNVVFRNDQVPRLPISYFDEGTPFGLFDRLDMECIAKGPCDAVVIPHNSNLSAGIMFEPVGDVERARQRARYEVLAEIMQHKGSSECYYNPLTSVDEYCAFEQLPTRSFSDDAPPQANDGFLREVLKDGLVIEQALGVNPFQFGFIGSSDTHLGAPGQVAEADFVGHGGAGIPAAQKIPPGLPDLLEYNPGGLVVLWAEENSRDSLFGAMRRKEAYGTSGPRIVARLFAGPDVPEDMCEAKHFAQLGYASSVPMGGVIKRDVGSVGSARMTIAVQAMKDSQGLGLQKIQVIKGWLDHNGRRHEQVVDLAVSASAHSLDVDSCEIEGIGAPQLCAVWEDEQFDENLPSYYYSRILEGPSCRWSQYVCVANGVQCDDPATITDGLEGCCAEAHRRVVHERAWTSPVWYVPQGGEASTSR